MCTSHPLMVNGDSGLGVNSPPPASQTQVAWVQTLVDRKYKASWSGLDTSGLLVRTKRGIQLRRRSSSFQVWWASLWMPLSGQLSGAVGRWGCKMQGPQTRVKRRWKFNRFSSMLFLCKALHRWGKVCLELVSSKVLYCHLIGDTTFPTEMGNKWGSC